MFCQTNDKQMIVTTQLIIKPAEIQKAKEAGWWWVKNANKPMVTNGFVFHRVYNYLNYWQKD